MEALHEPPLSDYEQRKAVGKCTREGCRRQASEDSSLCRRCHRKQKRYNRESAARKRAAREAAGLCVSCPGDKPLDASPGSTSCLPCRIKRRRLKVSDGGVESDLERAAKIAAATRTHEDGRTRYHGQQKRGQQPKWQLNLQDLRHVTEDFDTFSQGIKMLAEPAAQAMHRSDRTAAELAVASVGERMGRRTDDILERLGHFKQRHGRRDGE